MRSPSFGILTVLHLKWWLTRSGDCHFQFCVVLKYEIIDVFGVKNIPLSLKMSSASGGLCPRPPTGASPLDPTGGLPSKKSLNYTMHYWTLNRTLNWSEAARNKVVRDDIRRKAAIIRMVMLTSRITNIVIIIMTVTTKWHHHFLSSQRGSYEHWPIVQRFRHCVVSQHYRRRHWVGMRCRRSVGRWRHRDVTSLWVV